MYKLTKITEVKGSDGEKLNYDYEFSNENSKISVNVYEEMHNDLKDKVKVGYKPEKLEIYVDAINPTVIDGNNIIAGRVGEQDIFKVEQIELRTKDDYFQSNKTMQNLAIKEINIYDSLPALNKAKKYNLILNEYTASLKSLDNINFGDEPKGTSNNLNKLGIMEEKKLVKKEQNSTTKMRNLLNLAFSISLFAASFVVSGLLADFRILSPSSWILFNIFALVGCGFVYSLIHKKINYEDVEK